MGFKATYWLHNRKNSFLNQFPILAPPCGLRVKFKATYWLHNGKNSFLHQFPILARMGRFSLWDKKGGRPPTSEGYFGHPVGGRDIKDRQGRSGGVRVWEGVWEGVG